VKPGTRVRIKSYGSNVGYDTEWVGKTGVVEQHRTNSSFVNVKLDDGSLGRFLILCLPHELEVI